MTTLPRILFLIFSSLFATLAFGQNCSLTQLSVRQNPCTGSAFSINYDFKFSNPTSSQYRLFVEGNEIGVFPYHLRSETIELQGAAARNISVRVEDASDSNCFAQASFEFMGCNAGDCSLQISDIDAGSCSGDGTFDMDFRLTHQGVVNPSFNLYSNGIFIGKRSINSGDEVTILNFVKSWNDENTETLTIGVEDFPACSQSVVFDSDLVSCTGCNLYNLNVEVFNCGGGQFFATIDFERQGGAGTFLLGGNGTTYGNFSYNDLPVTVGPLEANPSTLYEFVVFDFNNPLCFTFFDLGVVVCNDPLCLVEDLRVVESSCSSSDTYDLTINFEAQGSPTGQYEVSVNGTLVSNLTLEDLPYTIEGINTEGSGVDEITVCAMGDASCCASISVEKPNCVCEFTDFILVNSGCEDSNTEYFASFSFSATEGAGNLFTVFVNGIPFDINISSQTFSLNNLPLSGSANDEIRICSQLDQDCCSVIIVEKPDCTPICPIEEVSVEAGECDGILFTAIVQVSYTGTPTDILVIEVNGEARGAFPAFTFPINVSDLAGDGLTEHEFKVFVLGESCQKTVVLDPVNCSTAIVEGKLNGTLGSRYFGGNIFLDYALNTGEKLDCHVYDINGRLVNSWENLFLNGSGTIQLFTGDLTKGIYFLKIKSNRFTYANKFLAH